MRILWALLCCLGCIIQIVILVQQYMRYEISTSVTLLFKDKIHLPAVTVCSRLIELLNWNDERVRRNCQQITMKPDCHNMTLAQLQDHVSRQMDVRDTLISTFGLFDEYTIREILNMTVELDELLFAHLRFNQSTGGLQAVFNFNQTFHVSQFFVGIIKCFTLTWRREFEELQYLQVKQQYTSPGLFLFLTRVPVPHKPMLIVSYTENGVPYRTGYTDFLMTTAGPSVSTATYDLIKSDLLPAPFDTKCVDYSKLHEGLVNRGVCFERCYSAKGLDKFHRKPLGLLMQHSDPPDLKCMSESFLEKNQHELHQMWSECDSLCSHQDCKQTIHVARVKSSDQHQDKAQITGHMSYIPNAPVIRTMCLQKVTWAEFATDLSSTFGFWLGLSVMDALQWIERLTRKLLNRSKRRPDRSPLPRRRRRRHQHQQQVWLQTQGRTYPRFNQKDDLSQCESLTHTPETHQRGWY